MKFKTIACITLIIFFGLSSCSISVNDSIAVNVTQKIIVSRFDDTYLQLTMIAVNQRAETIRAFKGILICKDLFGEEIGRFQLEHKENILPKEEIDKMEIWQLNPLFNKDQKIINTKLDDMQFVWVTQSILLKEGSVLNND